MLVNLILPVTVSIFVESRSSTQKQSILLGIFDSAFWVLQDTTKWCILFLGLPWKTGRSKMGAPVVLAFLNRHRA